MQNPSPLLHWIYFDVAFSNMFFYLQIIVALLIILIVKWIVQRRRQLQLLQNLGYKVPPVHLVGGNLIELFTRCSKTKLIKNVFQNFILICTVRMVIWLRKKDGWQRLQKTLAKVKSWAGIVGPGQWFMPQILPSWKKFSSKNPRRSSTVLC